MKKFRPGFLPAIAWFIISTFLLTIPGSALPKENWLDKIWADKWVHIGMFSLLVFLWCWGTVKFNFDKKKRRKIFFLIAILSLAYGTAMEFVQHYWIVNRSFDVGDMIADAVGCSIGLIYSMRYLKKIDPRGL